MDVIGQDIGGDLKAKLKSHEYTATVPLDKNETIRLRDKYIGRSCQLFYREDPLKIVRAWGQYMYDEDDREYLDCINNVAHVGHCHPRVIDAATNQMKLLYTNNRFLHDNIVLYAERITRTMPAKLSVCFFVNSGSEANDLALRLARAHTKAYDVITVDHAYHGHLTSLIDISPYKFNHAGGEGQKPWVHVAPCPDTYRGKYRDCDYPNKSEEELGEMYSNDVKSLLEAAQNDGHRVAAFISESMQSCGGQVVYPSGYLRAVYRHVRAFGGVCIADEVQVGYGRMGSSWWAFQHQGEDVVPDIVTMGKPMGNGHPVSAVVCTQEVANSFADSGMTYFSTFGGNPVSLAIASAVLDVIESEQLIENAKSTGTYLINRSRQLKDKHNIIGDVRGHGLFLGIDLVKDRNTREPATAEARFVVNRLRQNMVIISSDGPHDNVLKMKPPLVFNRANVDTVIEKLDLVLTELDCVKNALGPMVTEGELVSRLNSILGDGVVSGVPIIVLRNGSASSLSDISF